MQRFPLILKFKELISGPGFVAGIQGRARLLLTEEEGKWWIYGVNPGSLADSGNTPEAAYINFRESFNNVLQDMAVEYKNYEDFIGAVSGFINTPDKKDEALWLEARKAIQAGQSVHESLESLERIKEEAGPYVAFALFSQPMTREVLTTTTSVPKPTSDVVIQPPTAQDNRTYQEALAA